MTHFDTAVLGAGPAGAIAATLLARRGFSVAIFDPDPRKDARIGESLPAFAADILEQHALPGPLSDNRHVPITGTISKWGGLHTQDDALMRPGGPDWRLDRGVFDAELRIAAITAGAIHFKTLAHCTQDPQNRWMLKDDHSNGLTATWVIDATGRRASIARKYGGIRHHQPSQVATWAIGAHPTATPTAKTLIETQDNGWWYGAVLPSGHPIAAFHSTNAQASEIRRQPDIWHRLFSRTVILSHKLSPNAFSKAQLHFNDASGTAISTPAGNKWVACGDAAIAFDPIASQGLLNAIRTGIAAADVVSGHKTAHSYCKEMQTVWQHYLKRYDMMQSRAALA